MGVTVVENNTEVRERYKINENEGLVVIDVKQGSGGHQLGLRPGDVILEVNKKKMLSVNDWNKEWGDKNSTLALLVSRGGQTLFISVDI